MENGMQNHTPKASSAIYEHKEHNCCNLTVGDKARKLSV